MKKNKKDIIIFIIIFIFTLIMFIPFLQKHYATDSYNILSIGYKEYAMKYSLNDGRVFMALIGLIAYYLKIPLDIYILTLTVLALFTSCICVMCLKKYILKIKESTNLITEVFVVVISYFTIFNFMYIENMLFVECFVMSLSILFYFFAAQTLINKEKNYIIKTAILLLFGILCYQGTISMYLISLLVFSLIKNEKYKNVLIDLVVGGLIVIVDIFLQLLYIKLNCALFNTQQERIDGLRNIIRNILITFRYLDFILVRTGYAYTKYLYLVISVVLEILIIIKCFKEKLNAKILIDIVLIIILAVLFALCINFISITAIWSARIRFSLGAMIGFILIYLYSKTDTAFDFKKIINILIIVLFILYALSIVINYISIMNTTIKVNKQDKILAIEIINYMEDYEKENNTIVRNIAIFPGKFENKGCYKNLKYYGSAMTWSAIRTEWSIKGILEMYSDKNFIIVEPDENKLEYYFSNVDKNIDYMCIDDTLYISYYVY